MRRYDTTFIIDGTLNDSERLALIERFAGILKRLGGDIEQIVRWGLRTLAYTINKRTHGYYVIFYFNANPSIIAAFERELRLNESILRYMTLLYDGKHPDYVRDEGATSAAIVIPETLPEITAEEEEIPLEAESDELGEIDETESVEPLDSEESLESEELLETEEPIESGIELEIEPDGEKENKA